MAATERERACKEGIPWGVAHGLAAVSLAECGHDRRALDLIDPTFFDRDAILAEQLRARSTRPTPFYAACRHCHAPVDALLAVMRANHLAAGEVQTVSVGAYAGALRIANSPMPRNG